MPAAKHNFKIECGATFRPVLTLTEDDALKNLTGYSARMKVRKNYDATPILSLTSGSGITLGGAGGTLSILVSATATAALVPGTYLYDLEIEDGAGVVTRLLEGAVEIVGEMTR